MGTSGCVWGSVMQVHWKRSLNLGVPWKVVNFLTLLLPLSVSGTGLFTLQNINSTEVSSIRV